MVEKAAINSERLLSRFLRYVQVNTTANAQTDEYPSSAGQWELGKILLAELNEIGADDVHVDANALVWAMMEWQSLLFVLSFFLCLMYDTKFQMFLA